MLDPALKGPIDAGGCPHLAVLLRDPAELPSVLASFYALGAKRNGWLVHRALPGGEAAERESLSEAGLDVAGLEDEGRLRIVEFDLDETAEQSAQRWARELDSALDRGFEALWYARFAVGAPESEGEDVVLHERAWDQTFRDRPAVTLCPYLVAGLDSAEAESRLEAVRECHDEVLVPAGEGYGPLPAH